MKCIICGRAYSPTSDTSYHKLLDDTSWMQNCQTIASNPESKNSFRICSLHFAASDFRTFAREGGKRLLKQSAIPHLNMFIKELVHHDYISTYTVIDYGVNPETMPIREQVTVTSAEDVHASRSDTDLLISVSPKIAHTGSTLIQPNQESVTLKYDIQDLSPKTLAASNDLSLLNTCTPQKRKQCWRPSRIGDLSDEHFATPKRRKLNLDMVKKQYKKSLQSKKNLKEQNRRLQKKVNTLQGLILQLKKKEYISENAANNLLSLESDSLAALLKRSLRGKSVPFTLELRKFALTLQYYSSRAYNFVRTAFGKTVLPHPSTIAKWYQVVDGSPGFAKEAFATLKSIEKPLVCNLVTDEMAIRQHIQWDGNKYVGFVNMGSDIGGIPDTENMPQARNALVFMAVALKQRWKIPLGYFFVNMLNGIERANLLKICLKELSDAQVGVQSLTFDGAAVNKAMCEKLGASFRYENLRTKIVNPHSGQNIFVIWDPCHMIKLLRNCLADKECILNGKGDTIQWKFIIQLYEKEKKEGLRLATKLTKQHIDFRNQKMNVRLAVQTLSESVSKALLYCENNYESFVGASATAEFCDLMNKAFDILNSRSKFSKKEYNLPISQNTLLKYQQFLETITKYINDLQFVDGTKVIHSRRNTGFMGIVISLENTINVYQQLWSDKYLDYLLTYRISQDHLETFFSCIRSRGGFNNNPTCGQFQAAYKRLLVHNQIRGSEQGNCTILDGTMVLACSSSDAVFEEQILVQPVDHDYLNSIADLSTFVGDVTEYIAGFVCRKIEKKIACSTCKNLMQTSKTDNLLFNLKNRGRLICPSEDVITICKWTERVIRSYPTELFNRNIKLRLNILTKRYIQGFNLFTNFVEHSIEQNCVDNHKNDLINNIINFFIDVRLHFIAKNKKIEDGTRQKLSKIILFKNQ